MDTETAVGSRTVVGVFATEVAARKAMLTLERAGMPPDRIGVVEANVRQAREVAGSYSPQGALVGALIGVLLVGVYVVFGGEPIRQNPIGVALGGFAIIGGLVAIGWLAGRARVFKEDEYEGLEDDSAAGETIVSVVCDTPDGVDQTRAIIERAGATEVRIEGTGESV